MHAPIPLLLAITIPNRGIHTWQIWLTFLFENVCPLLVRLIVSGPRIALSSQGYINGIVQGQNTPLHNSMRLAFFYKMCFEDSTWCGCKHVFGCFATCKTFCTGSKGRVFTMLVDHAAEDIYLDNHKV